MTAPTPDSTPNTARRRSLLAIATACGLAGLAWGGRWFTHGRFLEQTDDAYVAGNVIQITPQVAGTVIAIDADDTQTVRAGQTLVRLDPADARVALEQAEAQLGQSVREVQALYAGGGALEATVRQREADLARARDDLQRRQQVAGSGAVAEEEIEHARAALRAADAGSLLDLLEVRLHRVEDLPKLSQHPDRSVSGLSGIGIRPCGRVLAGDGARHGRSPVRIENGNSQPGQRGARQ